MQFKVVYSVANEGARLEIPDGPLGSLIAGTFYVYSTRVSDQDLATSDFLLCI